MIATFYSKAERDVYIQVVAERFGVPKAAISSDVEAIVIKNSRVAKREEGAKARESAVGYMDRINPDFIKAPAVARNEESLLGLLFLYPDHRRNVFDNALVTRDDFFTELGKKMFDFLKASYECGDDNLVSMNDTFSPEEVGRITKIKVARMQFESNDDTVLSACIEALKASIEKKRIETASTSEELAALIQSKRQQ